MAQTKICIVDDEEEIRDLVKSLINIRYPDIKVTVAGDGEAALDQLKKIKHDILITDLSMPNLEGNELIRAINDLEENAPAHILVISGFLNSQEDEGRKMGNITFMCKPVKSENIEKFIDEALK